MAPQTTTDSYRARRGGPSRLNFYPPGGTLPDRNPGNDGLSLGSIQAKATQVVTAQGSVTKSETKDPEYYGYFSEVVVSYSLEVLDTSVGVQPVTLYAKSIGSAVAAGQSTASGFFEVEQTTAISGNPAKVVLNLPVCAGQGCPAGTPSSYSVDQPISMLTNTDYLILLQAVAGATNQTSPIAAFSGSSSVSIDPYFYLDPSIADPQDYSLLFSPGIINSPSNVAGGVPEPSTWAMMVIGFVGLGYAGYRGRRRLA